MFPNVDSKPFFSIPRALGRVPCDRDLSRVLLPADDLVFRQPDAPAGPPSEYVPRVGLGSLVYVSVDTGTQRIVSLLSPSGGPAPPVPVTTLDPLLSPFGEMIDLARLPPGTTFRVPHGRQLMALSFERLDLAAAAALTRDGGLRERLEGEGPHGGEWWAADGVAKLAGNLLTTGQSGLRTGTRLLVEAPDGTVFRHNPVVIAHVLAADTSTSINTAIVSPIVSATCTGVLLATLDHLQPLREGGWKPVVVVGATLLCSVPEGTAGAFVEPMLTAARAALDEVGVHLPKSLVTVAAREAWGSSTPSGTSRNARRSQGDDGRNP